MTFFKFAEDFLGDGHMALPVRPPGKRYGLAELLPWRAYDQETALYLNADSHGWVLELPALVGGNDELVKVLSSTFADVLPDGCLFQVLHWTDPHTQPVFGLWAAARREKGGVFAQLADHRCDYLAQSGWKSLFDDVPFLTRRCRVFLACSMAGQPTFETKALLDDCRRAISGAFKTLAGAPVNLEPEDFLNLIYRLLWPNPDKTPPRLSYRPHDPLHLQLIEPEADLSVVSDAVRWSSGVDMAVFYAMGYPEFWPQWHNGDLMGQEFNDLMRPVCPVLTCLSFAVVDKAAAQNRAFLKSAQAARKAGSDFRRFWPSIAKTEAEWKLTQGHLENGQALVQAGYRVAVMASRGTLPLEAAAQAVRSVYSSQGFRLARERNVQLPAFLSMLPHFGAGRKNRERSAGGVGRTRSMLTWSCANLAPLQGDWRGGVGANPPGLLAFSRRGEPALFNPFNSLTGNFNVAVAGKSGSGKSVAMQELVTAMAGAGAQVVVIDDGRSFEHSCHMLGGQFVEFSNQSEICLNPFSAMDAGKLQADDEYRDQALSLMVDMVCEACCPTEGASDYQRSAISKAVIKAWEEKGDAASMTTVRDCLESMKDPRADDLAHMISDYCRGGLSERFFEGRCNLRLDADLMVFELGELKTRKRLQGLVLMMIVFLATQRMFKSDRSRATAIVIDEAWDLLKGKSSGEFIDGVARRARKHKGSLITGTQSINDYYRTPAALAAFENAEYYLLLSQNNESINFLKKEERIDCDAAMEEALKSLRKVDNRYSEFMLICDGGWRVLRLILDPFSMALYSSKGEDYQRIRAEIEGGRTIEEAVASVAEQIRRNAA